MASQLVLALLAGVIAGALFSVIKIPIPAPPNLAGILGIVGIYLGYKGIEVLGFRIDISAVLTSLF
ncbi:XapX domain-containing protein [Haloferax profundi]|uniref:XapX domain-containing protein n=1 Tax=Haloferax profundi TaxID=1544718 RepID=UPI0009E73B83|nr:XapX domain-containing protein [Haloferax profundi]